MLNQNQVRDLVFPTIAAAKAAGRPGEICFVETTGKWYNYVVLGSGYTANDDTVLTTQHGGNTRWVSTITNTIADGETKRSPDGNSIFDALALKAPLISPSFTTPILGTPTSGTLTNCTSDTEADNNSTTQLATTAFAKSQDAVLARLPDQAVNMTAAASGSSGITVADNDNIDFGTGNFSLVWRGSLPDWTPSTIQSLILKYSITGYAFGIMTDGSIRINRSGTVSYSTVATGLVDGVLAEIVAVIDGTSLLFYVNGTKIGTTVVISAVDVSNASALYVLGESTVRYAGTCSFAATFNRALTAAEVLDLYRNGIAFADKWGSQTNFIAATNDRDFSSSTIGNWTVNSDGNGTCVYDAGPGSMKTAKVTVGSTPGTVTDGILVNAYLPETPTNKKYIVSASVYLPSGHHFTKLHILFGIGSVVGTQTIANLAIVDGWQTITNTGIGIAGSNIYIRGESTTVGDYFYFDNIQALEIGATLALEPEGIQNNLWYDSSSNALNASYPAAGWSLTRKLNVPRTNTGQPAFLAAASLQSDTTGDSSSYTPIFATSIFDQNNNLNLSTGVFTAPVTGRYDMSILLYLLNISSAMTSGEIYFMTSNRNYALWHGNPYAISYAGEICFHLSHFIDMDIGDTISCLIRIDSGSKAVDVATGCYFSGYLVC